MATSFYIQARNKMQEIINNGGGGGIRTPETLSSLTVFKTAGFNRSPTPPLPIITCNRIHTLILCLPAQSFAEIQRTSSIATFGLAGSAGLS
jgi:hypothetical protein